MSHPDNQRPWPVPARPWAMRMRWCDLLFAHWRVEAEALRRLIAGGLELDLFDGQVYVGAVPFTMEGVSPRLVPDIPGLHRIPELYLRTYVRMAGNRACGFSASMPVSGWPSESRDGSFTCPISMRSFRLAMRVDASNTPPYARIEMPPKATFAANYRPIGAVYHSAPGSLDSWLTDRYYLSAVDDAGNLYRGEIDHDRWRCSRPRAKWRLIPWAIGRKSR